MDIIVLENIRFQPDIESLKQKLRIKEGSRWADRIAELAKEAEAIARPRAAYGVAFIDSKDEKSTVVEGVRFDSRVLSVNLENTHRVFPFLGTCGMELHEWVNSYEDVLTRYYADEIAESALREALKVLTVDLQERYHLTRLSTMSPGSLPDWPIQAQRPLFSLFGDTVDSLGIRLTDSMLMIPSKSVSGIGFPTEQTFASCQLCPRERCPSRKAPYTPDLYGERYQGAQEEIILGLH